MKSKKDKPVFVSIDLGTARTLVFVSEQGIVYNEASIMAYKRNDQKLIGVGDDVYKMIGKGNRTIKIVRPMSDGVISDIKVTQDQLNFIFNKLRLKKTLKNCIMLLASPSMATDLEKNALRRIAANLGATKIFVEEEVKMAAIGAGINLSAATGNLIIDCGGGTTDIAVMSMGDIVLSKSVKVAGNYIDSEIQKYIKTQYGMDVGIKTAESVKINIGTLVNDSNMRRMKVYGRDVISGLPRECELTPEEISEVLKVCLSKIIDLIVQVLEETPPELAGDIFRNGLTICGGGAMINGIDTYISNTLQLPCKLGMQPLLSVINGTKKFESIIYDREREERQRMTPEQVQLNKAMK